MSKLKAELANLLKLARGREEVAQRRMLAGGLLLEVVQQANGNVQLTLERAGVDPADQEWQTVLKHWPELVPDEVTPTRRKEGRRCLLSAQWPRPLELFTSGAPEPDSADPDGLSGAGGAA